MYYFTLKSVFTFFGFSGQNFVGRSTSSMVANYSCNIFLEYLHREKNFGKKMASKNKCTKSL